MLAAKRVVVVGTGLLGTSIGLGLKRAGYGGKLVGVGRRERTLREAKERGAFDEVSTDVARATQPRDLVVLATPLSGFPAALDALAASAVPVTVTDVGSTKVRVMAEAAARLRDDQPFVGSHPMAGSEQQGPEGGRDDLFNGKPCVIVAGDADPDAMALVEALWHMLGMAILPMSAAEHDRAVATISHVPHLLSSLLVHLGSGRAALSVASTGFRDATRLASGNPAMWRDIIEWNRGEVVAAIEDVKRALAGLEHCVAEGRDEELMQWLASAKSERDAWLASRAGIKREEGGE